MLRGTRRWSQVDKKNYLQDGWNGCYEFYMFDARREGMSPISDEFELHLTEEEEMDTVSHDSLRMQSETTSWANKLELTEGEIESEERPFSEDEDSIHVEFDRLEENNWDCREWRDKYSVAIQIAKQKVYDHNESIKNDPAKKHCKPLDIDPFWNFALQQIDLMNEEPEEKDDEDRIERMTDDRSDATSTSLHLSKSSCSSKLIAIEETELEQDLNEAIIGIDSNLLEETDASVTQAENPILQFEDERIRDGEVIIIEGQEIELQAGKTRIERPEPVLDLMEDRLQLRNERSGSARFDYEGFKASLIKFRERQSAMNNNKSDI